MTLGFLYKLLFRSIAVLMVTLLSINYLPDDLFRDFPYEPRSIETPDFDKVIPLWNSKLSDSAEYLQLNQIIGPESIAVAKNGLIYTGLADGRLVELDPIKNYKLRQVLKFNKSPECHTDLITKPAECGRLLQMRFHNETLYAIDAATGLYKIDIKAGTKSLVGPKEPLNKLNLYNSFVFDPKVPNLVYLTVSSTKWDLKRILWSFMEMEASGQIIALDLNTGKRAVLVGKLMGTNGIDVDVKRDRLVFSQTYISQVNVISLASAREAFKNSKDGDVITSTQVSTLIPLVPGNPDNIIIDGDIAYIALPFVKPKGKELIDHLNTMTNVKKAQGRLMFAFYKLFKYVCDNLFYHPILVDIYENLESGHVMYHIVKTDKSGIIKYNLATGASEFLGSSAFNFLSEARPDSKGNLLLGSFRSAFLVKARV